jgi:hypothetical protein
MGAKVQAPAKLTKKNMSRTMNEYSVRRKGRKKKVEKSATIIGFRVMIDGCGILNTEYSQLPDEHVEKVFKDPEDAKLIKLLIQQARRRFEDIHSELEAELDALKKV